MDIEGIKSAIQQFNKAFKEFYENCIKPMLDKLKGLFRIYFEINKRIKYKPVKRIIPKTDMIFYNSRIIHCRNNC
jgi:hypothetical protein